MKFGRKTPATSPEQARAALGLKAEMSLASKSALFSSRLDRLVREFLSEQLLSQIQVTVRFDDHKGDDQDDSTPIYTRHPGLKPGAPESSFLVSDPLFSEDFLVVADDVRDRLDSAIRMAEFHSLIFDTWGLNQIESSPKCALNFHGPPGTGKTLAAHSVASALKKKILCANCADLESMFHGEGPKNVNALFRAAEAADAVLFIDEADSLLSKRFTSITQGSEQAINSMRSQLLLCLDGFKGVVIFATNLVSNYDSAFDSRVHQIHFPVPDRTTRVHLWRRHLPDSLPRDGVDVDNLADQSEGMVGRDIKLTVIDAAVRAARAARSQVTHDDFVRAIDSRRRSDPSLLCR